MLKKILHVFSGQKSRRQTEKKRKEESERNNISKRTAGQRKKRHKPKKKYNSENHRKGRVQQHPPPPKKSITLPSLEKLYEIPAHNKKTRFTDLNIKKELLAGIMDLQFEYCTPIQASSIKPIIAGRDIAAKAQTGTGKTAAFLISGMTRLLQNKKRTAPGKCRMLVLAPTRELALQIHKDAEVLGKFSGLTSMAVFGGMGYRNQRKKLKKHIDIMVGTPGRIIDFMRSREIDFSQAEILVIDEADRMLDMGFIPDVRRIVRATPPPGKRQTLLFSATLENKIRNLVKNWQSNPISLETEKEQTVTDKINQIFYTVSQSEKMKLLIKILRDYKKSKVLIFSNRKDICRKISDTLNRKNIRCSYLSGDLSQKKRLKILNGFKNGQINIIAATDVASRGIHVDDINCVINYDLPDNPEDYVHRIGRTGRAGAEGKSISFVCEYGAYSVPEIEKYLDMEIKSVMPDGI